MRQRDLVALLRAIANLLDNTTGQDMKDLVEGKVQLVLEDVNQEDDQEDYSVGLQKTDIKYVMDRIEKAESIEDGLMILKEEKIDKQRKTLETIARFYEVGIRKSEPLIQFNRRIINAVVGSRIQAEITQNIALTRKSEKQTGE